MNSVSKQEEDTEESNEQSVALMTLSSANQESSISTKHVDNHLANINNDKVSISNIRIKFLTSTDDVASSTSNSSAVANNLLKAEGLCFQDKTIGNLILVANFC